MPTFNGRTVVTMPAAPLAPASFEFQWYGLAAVNRSPFTGQQQVYDWGSHYAGASVAMPAMSKANGQLWAAFFAALDGVANVFQFSSALCAAYPNELTSNGTTPRYWCLKSPPHWSVKAGSIYGVVFEIEEAL